MTDLTIPLDPSTDTALDQIAATTQRPKSEIAAEAIAAYVRREAETIAKIKAGQADVAAGRTIPHEQVMREAREIVEAAKRSRR